MNKSPKYVGLGFGFDNAYLTYTDKIGDIIEMKLLINSVSYQIDPNYKYQIEIKASLLSNDRMLVRVDTNKPNGGR